MGIEGKPQKSSLMRLATFFILFIFGTYSLTAQTFQMDGGDTINYKDINGKKQKHWKISNKMKKLPGYTPDQIVEEGDYKNSRKMGLWKKYFANGNVKDEITYVNSRPNGPYKVYYENGKIEEQGVWKNNRNTGSFKRYHPNGNVAQAFNFSPTGKREGKQVYYHENGKVAIEGSWNGGKESGELVEYYDNGEVKARKYFNEGQMDAGKSKFFESKAPVTDQLKKEEQAAPVVKAVAKKDEKPNHGHFDGNGYYKLYNKNKLIVKDGTFKNYRLMNGKWYRYDDDGILENIEIIKNGRYIGDAPLPEEK